jgi:uncharacterized metal-binding protein (TIGR02443 family)
MQDKAPRRRFIAGAVCPRCARMDKIVVDLDTDQRECVACGFSEGRPGPESPGHESPGHESPGHASPQQNVPARDDALVREVPTRVSRAAARRVETPAEAITLVDLAPAKDP